MASFWPGCVYNKYTPITYPYPKIFFFDKKHFHPVRSRTWYTPVTEKRPTLEPALDSDVAFVLVDTWKRPMVVDWLEGAALIDEAPFTASVSQMFLDREEDRCRVFSGLEGEEDDVDEDEEEVEEGVSEEEDTMLEGCGALVVPSAATDTWGRERRDIVNE